MKKSRVFIAIFGLFVGFPQAFAHDSSDLKADSPSSDQESSSLADSSAVQVLDKSRYHVSGVTSILPGFGVGHAVQGRWTDKG